MITQYSLYLSFTLPLAAGKYPSVAFFFFFCGSWFAEQMAAHLGQLQTTDDWTFRFICFPVAVGSYAPTVLQEGMTCLKSKKNRENMNSCSKDFL